MPRTLRVVGALTVGLVLALAPGGALAGKTQPKAAQQPIATHSFGIALPEVPGTTGPLDTLSTALGRRPDRVTWYVAWSLRSAFPAQQAAAVAARGATPVITWEPWDPAAGTTQPAYTLDAITAGAWDSYLTQWARQARSYGGPVVLRLAHEGNGSWYPWSVGVNGNTAGDYVAAWRHVVDLFNRQRASNVVWQWSQNIAYRGSTPLASIWPGPRYVEEVGLDGYIWAGVLPGTTYTSFADLFRPSATQVRTLTSLPLYVSETATPEGIGDKAAWVADMFATLAADPTYAGFTWFSYDKEVDWRLDSSDASFQAFRAGLAGW